MSKTLRRGTTCLFTSLFISGCAELGDQINDIVFIPNPNSDLRNEELISLELAYSDRRPVIDETPELDGFIQKSLAFAGLGDQITGLAYSQFKKSLLREAKRYTATYSASASSDQFYYWFEPELGDDNHIKVGTDPADSKQKLYKRYSDIKFSGFIMERSFKKHKNGERLAAMRVCAIALPTIDDGYFQIVPVSYEATYSKAKLIGFNVLSPLGVDLLNPWELITNPASGKGFATPPSDRNVDMSLSVAFEYLWYNDNELTATESPTSTIELSSVPITGKPMQGHFPAYAAFTAAKGGEFDLPCDKSRTTKDIADLRDRIMTDVPVDDFDRMKLAANAEMFPSAPRTLNGRKGNANFTMKLTVTEYDDYGENIMEMQEALPETKEDAVSKVESLLRQR